MTLGEAEMAFLQKSFHEYYAEASPSLKPPKAFDKREFGFIPFRREKSMMRHKGFKSRPDLAAFLVSFTPSDAYYSSAYYERPEAEDMAGKGWLGADLIFDIDSDHIVTPCKTVHDSWKCLDCGLEGRGVEPEKCPRCGRRRIEADKWVCEWCLEAAKRETLKLLSILEDDFGFSQGRLEVVFSGHRGYHVHVDDETVLKFSSEERKEIVDYVSASGLKASLLYPELRRRSTREVDFSAEGWRGRIARAAYSLLLKKGEELKELGLTGKAVRLIEENREKLLRELSAGDAAGIPWKTWEQLLQAAASLEAALVDTVVTTDVHRLIRLPGSLHGKTGLKVVLIDGGRLPEFNPLTESLAFTEERNVKVKIVKPKPLKLGGVEYKFKAGETVEISWAPAVYMVGTGMAVLAGGGLQPSEA
ncbi:MAG: hypothetical protein DRO43_03480 [Candidatus Hecatellales archaeon]|nr:MAG: hypothetical protein DRO43_03480 [Candidatus Hecatellales archaeon]